MRRILTVLSLLCILGCTDGGSKRIEQDIERIIRGKRATVGAAVLLDDGAVVSVNDNAEYPAMSVFKFHVVVAAMARMERENIPLDSMTEVAAASLLENTYSPLRDVCVGRDTCLSFRELIRYTVTLSDNNTCDLLIDFAGGIDSVSESVRRLGMDGFDFTQTENSMHEDISRCYDNWIRPSSMVKFMARVYEEGILGEEYLDFLERTMKETSTGVDKIRAGVPDGIAVGHKTGSSDRTAEGIKIGDNDAGVVYGPGGRRYYLSVFVRDSAEPDSVNAAIIASISRAVYRACCAD